MIERDENGLPAKIMQCVRELCEWRRRRSHCRVFHEKPVFGCIFCIVQKSPIRDHGGDHSRDMYEAAERLMRMKEEAAGKTKLRKAANVP